MIMQAIINAIKQNSLAVGVANSAKNVMLNAHAVDVYSSTGALNVSMHPVVDLVLKALIEVPTRRHENSP
jgi:hypothetical protein